VLHSAVSLSMLSASLKVVALPLATRTRAIPVRGGSTLGGYERSDIVPEPNGPDGSCVFFLCFLHLGPRQSRFAGPRPGGWRPPRGGADERNPIGHRGSRDESRTPGPPRSSGPLNRTIIAPRIALNKFNILHATTPGSAASNGSRSVLTNNCKLTITTNCLIESYGRLANTW
jgi:hypothetical protein